VSEVSDFGGASDDEHANITTQKQSKIIPKRPTTFPNSPNKYSKWSNSSGTDGGTALDWLATNQCYKQVYKTKKTFDPLQQEQQEHNEIRNAICAMMGGFSSLASIKEINQNITEADYRNLVTVATCIKDAANNRPEKNKFYKYTVDYLKHFIKNVEIVNKSQSSYLPNFLVGPNTNVTNDIKQTIDRIITERDNPKLAQSSQSSPPRH
jgi:hypothetical protein